MAQFHECLNSKLQEFIERQKIFFVASAPIEGRVNLSPKGLDTLQCLDENRLAYLDLTGSGNETAAHLIENGRITLMFCSFSESPMILRVYGQGSVIRPRDREWDSLRAHFGDFPGERQIVLINVGSVQTSCGFAVPIYEHKADRNTLIRWAEKMGPQGIEACWHENNRQSIDGLPTHSVGD